MQSPIVPYECDTCPTTCTPAQVPGPAGTDGTNGLDGQSGASAFTLVVTGFVMPAVSGLVTVEVLDTAWMVPAQGAVDGQYIAIEFAGTLLVESIIDATHVSLLNPGAANNAAPGTAIPAGARVGVSGVPGATGGSPTGALLAVNNLSDLTNIPLARTNIGLGTAALAAVADFLATANNLSDVPTKATARTNLGLAIGTNVQAYNAMLAGLVAAGPGAADKVPVMSAANTFALFTFTAAMRTLMGSATNADLLTSLKVFPREGLIGSKLAVDMNSVLDQSVTMTSTKYRVTRIVVTNASVNMTTAQGGVYNANGKPGGGILVGAAQAYTALSTATKFIDLTLAGVALTDVQTAAFLVVSLTTPQGVAATADFYIFGEDLS